MKCKTMRHEIIEFQWMTLLLLFTICFSSCKDDKDASAEPYDPSQPVTVTDFAPKAGGANTRMIIYGSNFGTDSSIVFVKIGGKEAKVINAKGNSLYCITPQQCYEGTIEVKVGEQDIVIFRVKLEPCRKIYFTTVAKRTFLYNFSITLLIYIST